VDVESAVGSWTDVLRAILLFPLAVEVKAHYYGTGT
jgi:hypothetical protein